VLGYVTLPEEILVDTRLLILEGTPIFTLNVEEEVILIGKTRSVEIIKVRETRKRTKK
jgi:hypothetical protein